VLLASALVYAGSLLPPAMALLSPADVAKRREMDKRRDEAAAALKKKVFRPSATYDLSTAPVSQFLSPCPPNTPGSKPNYFECGNFANSPLPKRLGGAITGGMRKFVDTLPGLGAANANNLGQYIPIATNDPNRFPGSDYYEIGLTDYSQRFHSDLPPSRLRGYKDLAGGDGKNHYLGPLIIARKDRPVRIKFKNLLPTGSAGDLFLPVDKTYMGAGEGPMHADGSPCDPVMEACAEYTENRATLHLHGGDSPWISDGTPHQWITPAGESTPYKKGVSHQNVPDMVGYSSAPIPSPNDGDGMTTFFWPNNLSGRMLFYHDHALGITRLNVYAGEAAGYLITDPAEDSLIDAGLLPNLGGVYRYGIPLVIQDKAFVPPTEQLAQQDPTWDTSKWGGLGSLWFPHVYMPNQNPAMPDGMNPFGRWHYGPWFWPPISPTHGPNPDGTPGVPDVSSTPESWMDTPVVNGTAYPVLPVQRRAYRFRILNASNDRFFNLQLYYADPANPTEVKMVPAEATRTFPAHWPAPDHRLGGLPDPDLSGPDMIQLGTEGGWLKKPIVIKNTPIGYDRDPMSMTVMDIKERGLFLGSAERADVIIDFSKIPANVSKVILYNDAPAAVPAGDRRNDYYTGDEDNSYWGGAPTTLPGYGPNIRTIMQFQVSGKAEPAFNLAALEAAWPAAYASVQPQDTVPEGVYAILHAESLTFSTGPALAPVTIPTTPKAIAEEMDMEYGRMTASLGVEHALASFNAQTTVIYKYIDPTTEFLAKDEIQIWKITHNGVDAHPVHFHAADVQLINRVDWAGVIKPPYPGEGGWKETIKMHPLQDTIIAVKQHPSVVPFNVPHSVRPLDPTMPMGAAMNFTGIDTVSNPISPVVTNELTDFGNEYVWHCHILGHEENDMMRPLVVLMPPTPATNVTAVAASSAAVVSFTPGLTGGVPGPYTLGDGGPADFGPGTLTYTVTSNPGGIFVTGSGSPLTVTGLTNGVSYTFTVTSTNGAGSVTSAASNAVVPALVPDAPTSVVATGQGQDQALVSFQAPADNGSPITLYTVTSNPGQITATGTASPILVTGLTDGTPFTFTVVATNAIGDSPASAPSNVITLGQAPLRPTGLKAVNTAASYAVLSWTDNAVNEQGYTIERSADGGVTWVVVGTTGANAVYFRAGGLTTRTKYLFRVQAFNGNGVSAYSNVLTVTTR
jgi:FtsP/CotA-like multicopper oxidase with cupredoxin domain